MILWKTVQDTSQINNVNISHAMRDWMNLTVCSATARYTYANIVRAILNILKAKDESLNHAMTAHSLISRKTMIRSLNF
jgi:adenylate kinase